MSTTRLALDAMGGDNAPEIVIKGADVAKAKNPELEFVFVGNEARISSLLKKTNLIQDAKIIHADDKVEADENVSQAVRKGKETSMWKAIAEVKKGHCDAIVSAGNTGALMAISKLQLRPLEGVKRPAIATFLPTLERQVCMLDLGANIECDAENLVQFGIMGAAFSRSILEVQNPSVGLLNVGEEDQKGHDYLREAAEILSDPDLGLRYTGFVEGTDITKGLTDVVVTDGFTGNVALKTAEGTATLITSLLRQAFSESFFTKMAYLFAAKALKQMRHRLDPRVHNGAVFLGLNGIAVKSHGGTDYIGYANAIKVAADLVEHGFIPDVQKALEKFTAKMAEREGAKTDE
ncbi:MAG: phosphate acyltransferase PlsX [Candidatus Puniceispirillaceae bacterium]